MKVTWRAEKSTVQEKRLHAGQATNNSLSTPTSLPVKLSGSKLLLKSAWIMDTSESVPHLAERCHFIRRESLDPTMHHPTTRQTRAVRYDRCLTLSSQPYCHHDLDLSLPRMHFRLRPGVNRRTRSTRQPYSRTGAELCLVAVSSA